MKKKKVSKQDKSDRQVIESRKHEPAYTLEDIVKAAQKQGMSVDIKLLPKGTTTELVVTAPQDERPLLNIPADQWPGDPGCRSVIAAREVTNKRIEREFKDNPSSKWVITPYEIIERQEFFKRIAPKPLVVEAQGTNVTAVNPS